MLLTWVPHTHVSFPTSTEFFLGGAGKEGFLVGEIREKLQEKNILP
jgi:hypothetical protein